jgi:hypothetical protein
MAISTVTRSPALPPVASASAAEARVSRAGGALAAVGLAASLVVVLGLFATWRVGGAAPVHHVSILGQRLSYPSANLAGLIVLVLGATASAACGAVREVYASLRFSRRVASDQPTPYGDALVVEDERPLAFCAGLLRPRVYVSTGALALLDDTALDAVLAHERHHARRRDPLRLAAGRVLARALFFMPGLGELSARQQSLAELSADESALSADPDRGSALARAMLGFSEAGSAGFEAERVDYLLGDAPSWRFPAALCLVAAGAAILMLALGLLAERVAAGSATLAPPFLSRQPCVVVLALIPAALAVTGLRVHRRLTPN